jgi:multidrug transporter EmrE-like cation transporter
VSEPASIEVGRRPPPTGWFLNPYLQIGLGAVLVAASELMLKKGASAVAGESPGWFGVAALASPWTWGGIVCYIASFLSWLHVLRFVPLSIAFPLINVVHVLVPLGVLVFLHEPVSLRRWIGVALILVGILAIMRPATTAEAKL